MTEKLLEEIGFELGELAMGHFSKPEMRLIGERAVRACQRAGMVETTAGVSLIAAERTRQMEEEGWTAEHDAKHGRGELAAAASCYAWHATCQARSFKPDYIKGRPSDWPWEACWWKPSADRIRNLVKAGALIAAEIDRLARLRPKPDARVEKFKEVIAKHLGYRDTCHNIVNGMAKELAEIGETK